MFYWNSSIQSFLLLTEVISLTPHFGVRFSVAGLDHRKFSFYQFQIFLFIVAIVMLFLLKTTF